MNINATLLGQMITFLLFVLFTKKFVWSYLQVALSERQHKIAEGLAAAERGHHDLALAQEAATKKIREAKQEAARILDESKRLAAQSIENAKADAQVEASKIKEKAESDIEQMVAVAQNQLKTVVSKMALVGAEKILKRHIDEAANQELLDDLVQG